MFAWMITVHVRRGDAARVRAFEPVDPNGVFDETTLYFLTRDGVSAAEASGMFARDILPAVACVDDIYVLGRVSRLLMVGGPVEHFQMRSDEGDGLLRVTLYVCHEATEFLCLPESWSP